MSAVSLGAAIGVALASAAAFAGGAVAQHHAAAALSEGGGASEGFAKKLVRSPLWWTGIGLNTVGFVLHALALAFGSLVVVQPVLVLTLVFALPLGAKVAGQRLSPVTWGWSLLLVLALGVFLVDVAHGEGLDGPPIIGWAVASAIGVPIVAVCLIAARRRRGVSRAALLAVCAGTLAGAHAVIIKQVVDELGERGLIATVLTWGFVAFVVIGAVSLWMRQLAYHADWLHASLPTMLVLEPVVAAALGILVLGERIDAGSGDLVLILGSVVVMAVATVQLGRRAALVPGGLAPESPAEPHPEVL